uniref:Uncharacterized protein n=1 Tax=Choanephora cucurbitarum TaxID=101091 RepID=A0A1C7NQK7_9FUNG
MDFDSDSSDFHFPSDTGLAKLSSPLSHKVPESRDWALDEFIQTLQDKPYTEAENLLSFKQYIPVNDHDDNDDYNYGPPKLNLPTFEEKDFLSQLSQHLHNLERMELHDILKGGFTLVQNDIQTNSQSNVASHQQHALPSSPFNQQSHSPPGLSWFNEAVDYGRVQIDNLDTIEMPKRKNNFSPFSNTARVSPSAAIMTSVSQQEEKQALPQEKPQHQQETSSEQQQSEGEDTTVVQPESEKPLPPLPMMVEQEKATKAPKNKPNGLKFKLKNKFVKPFNNSISASTLSEKPKKPSSILSSTKKFIRKILPVSSA